jgi:hypothetical protein
MREDKFVRDEGVAGSNPATPTNFPENSKLYVKQRPRAGTPAARCLAAVTGLAERPQDGACGGASALSTPALIRPAVICCILFIRSTAAAEDSTSRHAG